MTNQTNSVTVVFNSDKDIPSILEKFGNVIDKTQSPSINISGLIVRRVLFTNQMLNLCEIRKVRPLINIWLNHDEFNVLKRQFMHIIPSISFGSITDMSTFNSHKKIDGISVKIVNNRKEIFVIKQKARILLSMDCLEKYFIIDQNYHFFLLLKKPARCFEEFDGKYLRRCFVYTEEVTSIDLADTSVICLTDPSSYQTLMKFLIDKMQLQCFHSVSPIKIQDKAANTDFKLLGDNNFLAHYALEMVLSLGYNIKDRLTTALMTKIKQSAFESRKEQYPEHRFYRQMIAIYHIARKNRFFNFEIEFDKIEPQWIPPKQPSYDYVPRIFLTPYGQYPRPLKQLRGNRVLRQHDEFGPATEHFCRVTLRDCDMNLIQSDLIQSWRQQLQNILNNQGLIIGRSPFHFLLFSNSQLRDASFYFYHKYKYTVDHILQWMGNFNHEKAIGTRIARMAQCFTSTTHGINLQSKQLIPIPDLFDAKNRCFTDGCGKISSLLLRKRLPCVIQIRCGGLKGTLVESPDLQGDVIHYRPSQLKFESNHLVIELMNYSKPKSISFNRQVITLLEHMGIPTSMFIEFQNRFHKKLSMGLISQNHRCLTFCRKRLQQLLEKTHIPISMSDGRMLYGIVDETYTLEYGEVFIQITDEKSDHNKKYRIICETNVIVRRMPCHHPGDIRVLRAVDKPCLHHYVDCIVFPVKGPRPHSTEMAGGDYDGDEYWTCWSSELIQQIPQMNEPAEYAAPEKTLFEGEHTKSKQVEFILDILMNRCNIGILSRRHLAICALKSPDNSKALKIAQFISDTLDFPKTGVNSITEEILQQYNVHEYPGFMKNKTKETVRCDKALNHLFHEVEDLHSYHSSCTEIIRKPIIDPDFLIVEFEKYIKQAERDYANYCNKMWTIINTYGLNDETEVITRCHFNIPEESSNNEDAETAGQDFRALRAET
ncbi:hypothetical protein I4U23_024315 [Adineta vaga]|nr:hypothetical protein I4U23_024315 [Adineta vaga]